MSKYVCHTCGVTYEYCRGCHLSPILHQSMGYCSIRCYEMAKNKESEKCSEVSKEGNKDTLDIT